MGDVCIRRTVKFMDVENSMSAYACKRLSSFKTLVGWFKLDLTLSI